MTSLTKKKNMHMFVILAYACMSANKLIEITCQVGLAEKKLCRC